MCCNPSPGKQNSGGDFVPIDEEVVVWEAMNQLKTTLLVFVPVELCIWPHDVEEGRRLVFEGGASIFNATAVELERLGVLTERFDHRYIDVL